MNHFKRRSRYIAILAAFGCLSGVSAQEKCKPIKPTTLVCVVGSEKVPAISVSMTELDVALSALGKSQINDDSQLEKYKHTAEEKVTFLVKDEKLNEKYTYTGISKLSAYITKDKDVKSNSYGEAIMEAAISFDVDVPMRVENKYVYKKVLVVKKGKKKWITKKVKADGKYLDTAIRKISFSMKFDVPSSTSSEVEQQLPTKDSLLKSVPVSCRRVRN